MTSELPVEQGKDGMVYRCVLEQLPTVLSGVYDYQGNSLYTGEPSEPLVLEYHLGNDLEIERLTFDWLSPEFIDNPSIRTWSSLTARSTSITTVRESMIGWI